MKVLRIIIPMLFVFMTYCSEQAVTPDSTANIRFEFAGPGDVNLPHLSPLPDSSGNKVMKSFSPESIDEVKIMILDFSAFDSSRQYFDSPDFEQFKITRDNWPGDLHTWGEWERLLGDHFRIVADQNLNIENDEARGVVAGVIGLNYIFIMLLENGREHNTYEGDVVAIEGETVTVRMYDYWW